MVDVTPEQLAASLIADVPRIYPWSKTQPMMLEADVLAALAAAVPADLAEAWKVLEGVTPGRVVQFHPSFCKEAEGAPFSEWDTSHDLSVIQPDGKRYRIGSMRHADDAAFFQWCREGVPALLARIAAQEAQIKGLEADVAHWRSARDGHFNQAMKNGSIAQQERSRAEVAETALAASEARVAKLVEALAPFAEYIADGGDHDDKGEPLPDTQGVGWVYLTFGDFRRARAAITEAGHG